MKSSKELNLELEKKEEPSETNYQTITNSLNKTSTSITHLPADVLLLIFSYLNTGELTQIASVCKLFCFLAANENLWKNLLIKIRGTSEIPKQQSYKQIYANEKYTTALKLQAELKRSNPDLILDMPKIDSAKNFKKLAKRLITRLKKSKNSFNDQLLNAFVKSNHSELTDFLKNNKEQLIKKLDTQLTIQALDLTLRNSDPEAFPTLAWFLSNNDLFGRLIADFFRYIDLQKHAYILAKLAATLHEKLVIYSDRLDKVIPLIHYIILANHHMDTPWLLPLLVAYDMHCLTYKYEYKDGEKNALLAALEISHQSFRDPDSTFSLICKPFYPVLKFHGSNTLYPVIPTVFWHFPQKAFSFLTHMKKSDVTHYRDWENGGINQGNTVLHYAVRQAGNFKVYYLKKMIKNYRELTNVVNQEGKTLLHMAIDEYRRPFDYPVVDIIQILLEYDIDINSQDKNGITALDTARNYAVSLRNHMYKDLTKIIKLLEEKNEAAQEGKTDYQSTPKL